MKAIQVKYLGCTTHKSSRWKAFAEGALRVTLPYDHALNPNDNAKRAALTLIEKMNWKVKITGEGNLPNGDYVFTIGH
jgi:hypothetical protein